MKLPLSYIQYKVWVPHLVNLMQHIIECMRYMYSMCSQCTYRSVPRKRPWALKRNSRFWPAWVLTRDQNFIHLYRSSYSGPLKCGTGALTREWALARDTTVISLRGKITKSHPPLGATLQWGWYSSLSICGCCISISYRLLHCYWRYAGLHYIRFLKSRGILGRWYSKFHQLLHKWHFASVILWYISFYKCVCLIIRNESRSAAFGGETGNWWHNQCYRPNKLSTQNIRSPISENTESEFFLLTTHRGGERIVRVNHLNPPHDSLYYNWDEPERAPHNQLTTKINSQKLISTIKPAKW